MLPEKRALGPPGWSGDVVNAQYYLPEGESIENIGYWYPADGGGIIGSDASRSWRGAEARCSPTLFLNYMLDADDAVENFGWLGYQPPQTSLDPDSVVADGYVPAHLESSASIRPEDFETG